MSSDDDVLRPARAHATHRVAPKSDAPEDQTQRRPASDTGGDTLTRSLPGARGAETPRDADAIRLPARYVMTDVIGRGGMGCVVRARDQDLDRDVAIKVMLGGASDDSSRSRMLKEARAAARLEHDGIVKVFDVDVGAGILVMELLDGESLREEVARTGALPPARVRVIAEAVLDALGAAHAAGIVHRDIKPSNVVVTREGRIVVVDFGVAQLAGRDLTQTGERVGTPAYMSPEQVRGAEVDARSDLYCLGATLHHLLAGVRFDGIRPIRDDERAKLEKVANDPGLVALVVGCLEPDPERRFANVAEARRALDRRLGVKARRVVVSALASALVLTTGVAAGMALFGRGPEVTEPSLREDPRIAEAFALAQAGRHGAARELTAAVLVERPDDPDVLTLAAFTDWWAGAAETDVILDRALAARLDESQRALVRGLDLIWAGRAAEAEGFLGPIAERRPADPRVLYALGEAQWHAGHLRESVDTLKRCFESDPRWQAALSHVVDHDLEAGRATELLALATRLRTVDAAAASTLEARVLTSERRYDDAVRTASAGLEADPDSVPLLLARAEARILVREIEGASRDADRAFELDPIDERERGPVSLRAEILLYRGRLAEHELLVGARGTRHTALAHALWASGTYRDLPQPATSGLRHASLYAAAWIETRLARGEDAARTAADHADPQVRALGRALELEPEAPERAAAEYAEALATPGEGGLAMLLAHHLARARRAAGDLAGAAEACDRVIHPQSYYAYRAAVLPDCALWRFEGRRDDASAREELEAVVERWDGDFAHPSITAARTLLADD